MSTEFLTRCMCGESWRNIKMKKVPVTACLQPYPTQVRASGPASEWIEMASKVHKLCYQSSPSLASNSSIYWFSSDYLSKVGGWVSVKATVLKIYTRYSLKFPRRTRYAGYVVEESVICYVNFSRNRYICDLLHIREWMTWRESGPL